MNALRETKILLAVALHMVLWSLPVTGASEHRRGPASDIQGIIDAHTVCGVSKGKLQSMIDFYITVRERYGRNSPRGVHVDSSRAPEAFAHLQEEVNALENGVSSESLIRNMTPGLGKVEYFQVYDTGYDLEKDTPAGLTFSMNSPTRRIPQSQRNRDALVKIATADKIYTLLFYHKGSPYNSVRVQDRKSGVMEMADCRLSPGEHDRFKLLVAENFDMRLRGLSRKEAIERYNIFSCDESSRGLFMLGKTRAELNGFVATRGLSFMPGGKSIEVNGFEYEFVFTDNNDPQFERIAAILVSRDEGHWNCEALEMITDNYGIELNCSTDETKAPGGRDDMIFGQFVYDVSESCHVGAAPYQNSKTFAVWAPTLTAQPNVPFNLAKLQKTMTSSETSDFRVIGNRVLKKEDFK